MAGQQRYDLVAQYDGLEGMVQDGARVVNMFRYYEEEDSRYCTVPVYCVMYCVMQREREHLCETEET